MRDHLSTPLPFPAPASPEAARAALADLADGLRAELAWAAELELAEREPSFELLERAADGALDEDEALWLEDRLAADPALARELDDLVELRQRLRPETRRGLGSRRSRLAGPVRVAGLAAALLVAVIGVGRLVESRSPEPPAHEVAADASEPLYADGFESGDSSAWAQ